MSDSPCPDSSRRGEGHLLPASVPLLAALGVHLHQALEAHLLLGSVAPCHQVTVQGLLEDRPVAMGLPLQASVDRHPLDSVALRRLDLVALHRRDSVALPPLA